MAAIGKIRKRSGLLLIAIGLAMLAFIISDAFSNNSLFFLNNQNEVGEIAGTPITYKEFDRYYQQNLEQLRSQSPDNAIDEVTRASLVEQTWNQLIIRKTLDHELGEMGIEVTPDELANAITGAQPHPQVRQAFTDPNTGQFRQDQLILFLKNLNQQPPEIQRSWKMFEQELLFQLRQRRLITLISKSFYITSAEAQDYYAAQNVTYDGNYIWASVMEIPDSVAQPSDEDVQAAYQQYKDRFKQKPGRTIEYVYFPIIPTAEDTSLTLEELNNIKKEWAAETNDSAYVISLSEEGWDSTWHPPAHYEPTLADSLWHLGVGSVAGPVFRNDKWYLFKVLAFRKADDTYYRASHILIQRGTDSVAALQKAKEILRQVKSGASFDSLAHIYGTDATRDRGGDLGWFDADVMVGPFGKAVRQAPLNQPFIVTTQFGYHVVVVKDTLQRDAHVVSIARSVTPSSETYDVEYRRAGQFHTDVQNGKDFKEAAIKAGKSPLLAEQIQPSDFTLPGLNYARPVVRFAYNAEEGDISEILELPGAFVVARLIEISESPYKPLDQLRDEEIRPLAMLVRKRKILAKKFENAGASSLEELASKIGKTVQQATAVRLIPPIITGIGSEPTVAGYFVGLPQGTAYWPIIGENGIAAVQPTQYHPVEIQDSAIFKGTRQQLLASYNNYWQQQFFETIKRFADVKDYKYRFY